MLARNTRILVLALAASASSVLAQPPDSTLTPASSPPTDSTTSGVTAPAPDAAYDTLRVEVEPPPTSNAAAVLADSLAPLAIRIAALERAVPLVPEIDRSVLTELVAAAVEMTAAGDEEAARLLVADGEHFCRERSR